MAASNAMPIAHRAILIILAALIALYHLYAAVAGGWPLSFVSPIGTYAHRQFHVGALVVLLFLMDAHASSGFWRWSLCLFTATAAAITLSTLISGASLLERSTAPLPIDIVAAALMVLLVLEACRRTAGPAIPITAILFIAYALLGSHLPQPWGHRGYSLDRLAGHLFISPEGIFGTPTGVSATLIILFTIYGSVLMASGAAEYFVALALRIFGRDRRGVVRSVTLASFLLGGPSGSGVATTILIGNVSYPLLARAGYGATQAGGFLAAGGLGAVLSPPVLGSAAFVLAEFLGVGYLDVLRMVLVPTAVYYLSLLLIADRMVPHVVPLPVEALSSNEQKLTRRSSILHFIAITGVLVFLLLGFSAEASAVFATVTALLCWQGQLQAPRGPWPVLVALGEGAVRSIGIAAVCASAGLIIGVISLTGLGLKLGGILTFYAGSDLVLISLLAVAVVMVVGLAVPVTGSYIICAVIVVPALTAAGVPAYAAHMFVFYFAVLSEVSPPTAMAPFAAAAITGADPIGTTMQAWRFVSPIAVLPLVAVLEPLGGTLLLNFSHNASIMDLTIFAVSYILASVALIFALAGRFDTVASALCCVGFFLAASLLFFPHTLAHRSPVTAEILLTGGVLLLIVSFIAMFWTVLRQVSKRAPQQPKH